ncbi:MAG: helix-turn-helix transcriptional regulator [Pyramidobacter sp.]|jgi:transcriptional regulator with XRE-family HTH domain
MLLREYRTLAHLSQAELAAKAGVSERSVIRWEQGGSLNMRSLMKLAKALDINPGDLLDRDRGTEAV